MRKTTTLIVAGLMAAAAAGVRAANYNDAGCGLGSMLFRENGKGQQILAGTTNGIGSQTSAISSQSSDCRERGVVRRSKEAEVFVAVNYRSLTRELAAGRGEYAEALADVLGCRGASVPAFLDAAKARYDSLLPGGRATPGSLLRAVEAEVLSDPAVACTL
ncbi:MAG: DUF3015 family protein [Elusimicrobia bacterium]|nr:DUF3015 family protein [Elusimicrobiota bacterium]